MPFIAKTNLPRIYAGEYNKFFALYLKESPLTTAGDESWTSPSSGLPYPATTGGELQLLNLLMTFLSNYIIADTDWNVIISTVQAQLDAQNILVTNQLQAQQSMINLFAYQNIGGSL